MQTGSLLKDTIRGNWNYLSNMMKLISWSVLFNVCMKRLSYKVNTLTILFTRNLFITYVFWHSLLNLTVSVTTVATTGTIQNIGQGQQTISTVAFWDGPEANFWSQSQLTAAISEVVYIYIVHPSIWQLLINRKIVFNNTLTLIISIGILSLLLNQRLSSSD